MEMLRTMTKGDTIEAIQRLNTTASPEFLAGFSGDELARYLKRLMNTSPAPRGDPGKPIGSDEPWARHAPIRHALS